MDGGYVKIPIEEFKRLDKLDREIEELKLHNNNEINEALKKIASLTEGEDATVFIEYSSWNRTATKIYTNEHYVIDAKLTSEQYSKLKEQHNALNSSFERFRATHNEQLTKSLQQEQELFNIKNEQTKLKFMSWRQFRSWKKNN